MYKFIIIFLLIFIYNIYSDENYIQKLNEKDIPVYFELDRNDLICSIQISKYYDIIGYIIYLLNFLDINEFNNIYFIINKKSYLLTHIKLKEYYTLKDNEKFDFLNLNLFEKIKKDLQ